ncbi:hypothetical protein SNE40_004184 [Patella caerulea]|uniref:Beta-glucosidase n=1 Tax=Patella caerulea TaxID=87958 RepID=A0AAN8K9G1_PATCE
MTFSAADLAASLRALEFQLGWWANPIFVNGDYPNVMKDYVAEKSIRQGFSESRLPKFTADEMKANKGTFDFMGINHYSSTLVYDKPNTYSSPSYNGDQDIGEASDMCWTSSTAGWLTVNPWGMKKILSYIRVKYNNPPIYITENGMPDNELDDELRINYYTHYINQALKAVNEGSNLQGYTAWSLLDNFEWTYGYVIKFGLFQVNFTDPARTRTARKSVALFQKLIADNGFVKN